MTEGPARPEPSQALFESLYHELRRIAVARMAREGSELTLQPTALVHEAYLRLSREEREGWDSRAQFVFAAAQAMRRILVERARRCARLRHGGEWKRVPFQEAELALDPAFTVSLDEVLDELGRVDRAMYEVVQLRFFGGLGIEECATLLEVSPRTVRRHWETARLWLHRRLRRREEVRDVG